MALHHGMKELNGIDEFCHCGHQRQEGEKFGRMFDLPPLTILPSHLKALGAQEDDQGNDGPMNGGTTSDRTTSVGVGDVFFGQFIDHDITLDTVTSLSSTVEPTAIRNSRTPALDLDNIYGAGPEAHPYLYHNEGDYQGVKLFTGADIENATVLEQHDLVRSIHGRAIIGDPRNDENRVVSQLQLGMINFHNHIAEHVYAESGNKTKGKELYEEARQLAMWHYQWVVIHDFLVKMCGYAVVTDILGSGRKYYNASYGDPYIPVEFSVAAYRFGHSMIPQKIQIQKNKSALELFGTLLGTGFTPLSDEKAIVDWLELVDSNAGRQVQMAEKLDTKLAKDLLKLPFIPNTDIQSLATRNLLRGQAFLLPSGENIAKAMERDESEIDMISQKAKLIAGSQIDLNSGTPLWFYILTEAETIGRETSANSFDKGEGLGPVGARIVAETLIGLIELDTHSYLSVNRNWEPADGVGVATLGEMMTYTS
jgi:hypothetical protein